MLREIKELLETFKEKDPARPSTAEVLLFYPGFHAWVLHQVAHRLWLRGHRLLARAVSWLSARLTGADIHPGARIGRRVLIDHAVGVVIGETAVVEDDVVIMHGVTLGNRRSRPGKRHPTVRRGAFLGAGAKVLGPVEIGEGAKVGAGAVVLGDVPPGATAVGVPAVIIEKNGHLKGHRQHAPCGN